ncbi:Threonine/homoserine efflux transporter RhtA [Dethiosulfatibacter aminovorans DSM 17477]|uniref:Threonine/homoserine efflux transporter RhtA n=1 Tax=Dethiosulfatibacter aminovorans DSM 17477 TaxID=1121476 RepID=A0A1M6I0T7_9FIRM|nr:DMT family transporter [Dethiosulfatibacter aminovorans]SHJ28073.1 Threonine/homoserine efflux transporter RhtA [Dethiosulfatibacter aminovorans DSM 17477]
MNKNEIRVSLLMTMGTFFWAGAFIAGKMGIHLLSPLILTFLRMFLATVIIFPFMVMREGDNWKIKREDIKYAVATGVVGMIGYHIFFFYALKYTDASKAAMINAINPLLTAMLAAVFLKEKLSPRKTFFILTALVGVILTLSNWNVGNIINFNFNIGDLLMFTGAAMWAIYSIIVKKVMHRFTPLKLTTYTFVTAAAFTFPFALPELINLDLQAIGWMPFLAVLYMAVFPSVLGYTIQQMAIKELGAARTALFINLVPVLSAIMAVVFLGEQLFRLNIVSGIIIIISVIMFTRQK